MHLYQRIRAAFTIAFVCGVVFAGSPAAAQTQIQPGQVIISELRLRGPAGPTDEFVELHNNTDQEIVVQATDTTAGWSVVAYNGQFGAILYTVPNGTRIPARGHFLGANAQGYSLSGYPSGNPNEVIIITGTRPEAVTPNAVTQKGFAATTPDATWTTDVPDGTGIALFSTTDGQNMSAATRLDAFGYSNSPLLFREGTGFPTVVTAGSEHTYYRDLRPGTPKDTNNNAADFLLVGTAINIHVTRLGAPGPQNLASPLINNTTITHQPLDPSVGVASAPNRERRPNVEPNADLGVLFFRRTFTNNTGQPVSRLRFRVIDLTVPGTPAAECGGGPCADVRALTSQDGEAGVGGQVVTVRGVTLEEPPSQPAGGGYNSSLSADFITLETPLAPGASVNIQFKLGVMRNGSYRFYLNIEALNSPEVDVPPPPAG